MRRVDTWLVLLITITCSLPSKYFREDDQPWETLPPASLPSGCPPGWPNHPFRPYVVFSLPKHNAIGSFEKHVHKNVRK